ncbi:MAG TPA: type I polyketide synthase [Elusimicrobia bacterium]|nr:type I polyketide synthase [Elusimicrobiota bacterium]HBT60337.1 type I polyketide synthase [Elusimicrobiota bacterium]
MNNGALIAVVGMGGVFPDAPELDRFWDNIAHGRCACRDVPAGRWPLSPEEAFDPARPAPDKVYSLKACLVDGFKLDPEGLELDPGFVGKLDTSCHLGLHAARNAWRDARTEGLDRGRVGVVIGNIVLPTDSASALARELLLPVLSEKLLGRRLSAEPGRTDPINRFAAGLPAGVIARALGLGGGAFALDAACASSLYALKLACDELRGGRADAMITGGVSRPQSLYTQMGFSQLRALSASGRPAPFDESADGLVVGEGAGMFVLKRLEDARQCGDRIYAVIRAVGLSNDVGGSLLAPNTPGQLRAMRQAYQRARWSPADVDLIECHSPGTPAGDPVEIASLKALWGERGWRAGQCPIGSVKSNVGHLLTAAGAAGLMKVLLAMQRQTLPPSANFTRPGARLGLAESPFRVQAQAAPWPARDADTPRRAAVSAFGFGGINAHVLVEEYRPPARPSRARQVAAPRQDEAHAPIAIVGMEARFGECAGLRRFQERVLGRACRTDGLSTTEKRWWGLGQEARFGGHYLAGVGVAPDDYRIPPKELEDMLPQQLLMLDVAARAVADARLKDFPAEQAGVFIGLGLDLNTTNFDLRWSLAEAGRRWAADLGWSLSSEEEAELIGRLRDAAGPALSANRTMGALGGIVASRVAREFHVGGPSFAVACEENSGLRALELAVRALQSGEIKAAIVGAVDVAGDVRSVLGSHSQKPFSASGRARPFDVSADGTVPGEGAAGLVLKRLDDAQRDADRVYAVIKGVGFACGGGVDRPAPSAAAYGAALRRAYGEAGVDPSTIGYLETHGSGCPAEDRVEAEALAEFYGTASTELPCALGSVKAQLGHAGAAAPLAGLVKAALALYQEILPPMEAFQALPELERAHKRFHVPARPQYWLRNRAEGPRRAGVSAMSIDGSIGHAILESAPAGADDALTAAERRQPLGARREALFVLEADDAAGLLSGLGELRVWLGRQEGDCHVEALARRWWSARGCEPGRRLGLVFVARDAGDLRELMAAAEQSLQENPERPIAGDRIHLTSREPFGPEALAFVFPGSGNQYLGMGVGLGVEWPEILRRQDAENGYLRDQMAAKRFVPWRFSWQEGWQAAAEAEIFSDFHAMIFGSVSHGAAVSDLVRSFGVEPRFVLGYSLGETAGLFSLRAWTARDEMLRRMRQSSLFVSDLAGPCDAARRFWNLSTEERMDWVLGVIDRPEDSVKMALKGMERAALLIVNAPFECVVGGYRKAVDNLVQGLGCVFLPLQGVSTVHFPAAELVAKQYRELHLLPTQPPGGVRFYSGAWGKVYEVTRESAADSITAQAVRSLDFSALVRRSYEDGARLFVELGPQASCTRMIGKILGPLPHMAKSACVKGGDEAGSILRLLAQLISERIPVDLKALYGLPSCAVGHQSEPPAWPRVSVALGSPAPRPLAWKPQARLRPIHGQGPAAPARSQSPVPAQAVFHSDVSAAALKEHILAAHEANVKAHETFLNLSQGFARAQLRNLAVQRAALQSGASGAVLPSAGKKPPFMNRAQCLEFAVGSMAKVLGSRFAQVDSYPSRVRLPGEPLMLVDRIVSVSGEPGSLQSGGVVTEHDVHAGAWYLDAGRIPTCIAVEAGQADLFLSGYLGIDFQTQGRRVYRLLDAEVTFHGGLPCAGETIRYDIKIDRFARHNEVWLFFFSFESAVGGRPLLSMRKGCAGFFTAEELAAGKGVVFKAEDLEPRPGKRPADWAELAPQAGRESYDDGRISALRKGDLAACFGKAFSGLTLNNPLTLPSGRMKLVDRILELDRQGGRYGMGLIRGEADIRPDDWHLVCHFKDDNVMPGTLMYECCLHTLRVLLMRMGWVGEADQCGYEPVAGVTSGLHCRGQVTARTRKVVYEVAVKELGFDPAPFAIADALMYADGKPIVRITDMSVRMGGTSKEQLANLWNQRGGEAAAPPAPPLRGAPVPSGESAPLFDTSRILAFAVGKPSEAFGEPYRVFDSERVIARLPGPPYQFLDRIVRIEGCEAFKHAAGGLVEARYDVPPDAWYFKSNGQPSMPFGVLLEVALQPCGWLAAYVGSALTSPMDLSFRNLGGTATQYEEIGPDAGTLCTTVKMVKAVQSAGMIIQDYEMAVRRQGRLVYEGVTEFGFFSKKALSEQVGVRGAACYAPGADEIARGMRPELSGLPDPMLLMLDSVDLYVPDGGPKGLGFVRGTKKVDPAEWFFKAHFYQDPVCPGSLGLESFIQLLKVAARERWKGAGGRFESMALGQKHQWLYRGQVIPANKLVTVEACVTAIDDSRRLIRADGFLKVDGLVIYKMTDFSSVRL